MNESHIFTNALKLASPAERAAYLDKACVGDPELRAGVEALLKAQASDPEFLERPPGPLAETVSSPPVADSVVMSQRPSDVEQNGAVIGPYKLVEQIGEGGMGAVYLAQQTEPVKRLVALKVIKAGMDSCQVLARFEAERQALALMDHPNIAKVLDAGTTPGGRPYFVMELVKGVPITKFCDERRLTPRQRLELFLPVCHAIQHAHQKGIIHRDIKPTNVLVALYDGQPVPKVIDFGVAKAAGQPLTERTLVTGLGAVVGTPEYMSPEQAELNQLDIDTRSDVYSLGILLYELLTGTTPLTRKRIKDAALLEVLRVIREEEPPRPSTRLSTTDELPSIAANRGTEPARLSRMVRGELDWIVMKALEKDRNRRYETANGFAMDVRRYLADEVVEARPPSAVYRLRKFVRRNRGRVVAAVTLALSIVVGLAAVMAVKAQADRDRAARNAWADASVSAATREARERAAEAWVVTNYPDRMERATEAAVAALRRADDYAAGGMPSETTLAELAAARRDLEELARHTRLIIADVANRQAFADQLIAEEGTKAMADLCNRQRQALRQFGLDPIDGPADEVARAISASRIRDDLLGVLLVWHEQATRLSKGRQRNPTRFHPDLPTDISVIADRLGQVIRSTRQLSGGAYARWQDLLDRKDVPGLVAFAASTDAQSFRSGVVPALGEDLRYADQLPACRAYLRAAVDRYPHDALLHYALFLVCYMYMQPPDHHEALRHVSAASALRPESSIFRLYVLITYKYLGASDLAIDAFRKVTAVNPNSAVAYEVMADVLVQKKDWDGAIAASREAIRLRPNNPHGHVRLGKILMAAGRHAEGLQVVLTALQQSPALVESPWAQLRYSAACYVMNCADGRGATPLPPAERPAYRKQALDLMTAELATLRKIADTDRVFVFRTTRYWLQDEDFASVRDPKSLDQLPPEERDAWNKLWSDVRELLDRSGPQSGSPLPKR